MYLYANGNMILVQVKNMRSFKIYWSTNIFQKTFDNNKLFYKSICGLCHCFYITVRSLDMV